MGEIRKLDVGTGHPGYNDYETLDKNPRTDPKHLLDIENDAVIYAFDEEFDEIRAYHVLEHIDPANRVKVMRHFHRWLKPGGILDIELPEGRSEQFYQDPTHRCPWTERTFWYFERGNHFAKGFSSREDAPVFDTVFRRVEDGWRLKVRLRKC